MLDLLAGFESLPLSATTTILTIVSLLAVLALSRAMANRWLWLAAVVVPLAIAYCAYWMPVWAGGGDPAQSPSWELFFMVAWGGAGTVACLILVAFLRLRRSKAR